MVFSCVSCGRKYAKQCGFRFFSFPKNEVLRNEWLKACGFDIHPKNDTKKMKLCSTHFEASSFRITRVDGPLLLKPGTIPSLFSAAENYNEATSSTQGHTSTVELHQQMNPTANSEISTLGDQTATLSTPKKRKIWGPRHGLKMSPRHFSTSRKAQRNLTIIKQDITKKDMRIKQLIQKTYRMRKKIKYLEQLIEHLQGKELVSTTTANILETGESSERIQQQQQFLSVLPTQFVSLNPTDGSSMDNSGSSRGGQHKLEGLQSSSLGEQYHPSQTQQENVQEVSPEFVDTMLVKEEHTWSDFENESDSYPQANYQENIEDASNQLNAPAETNKDCEPRKENRGRRNRHRFSPLANAKLELVSLQKRYLTEEHRKKQQLLDVQIQYEKYRLELTKLEVEKKKLEIQIRNKMLD